MKTEYGFSKGVRGKFYHPEAVFNFPVYLDPDVAAFLDMLAEKKQTDTQALVNERLRANIRLVQSTQ